MKGIVLAGGSGTDDSLMEASHFVRTIEVRQRRKADYLEGIAYHQGWLTAGQPAIQAQAFSKSGYAKHLQRALTQKAVK
jgi:glucose-1-phosphate thymidylyltransferase